MLQNKIEIYDTTLRDGGQAEGIAFSANDKLKIIHLLDELGVDYIEAGWPGANPKDIEVFEQAKTLKLKNAKITAFGCTRKVNGKAETDPILNQLIDSGTKIITIFGKTWDFHVEHALCTTLEENLNMVYDSIAYLKSKGKRVFFDAEHFYDGYKNNSDYALKAIEAAHKAGAERIILCDTNGGCLPVEMKEITEIVEKFLPEAIIGIHAHNDSDTAVANSIIAVQAGAKQVQGTFNGYGERCGNANLCSIIPALQLKLGFETLGKNIKKLSSVSRQISEIANRKANDFSPYVGRSAFTHKAGVHASGVMKNSSTYEHIDPETVGNARKILISDQAGTASIKEKISGINLGIDLTNDDMRKVLEQIKNLEWQGFTFEDADASFELMVREVLGIKPQYFELKGFRVISDTRGIGPLNTEASVKVRVGNEILHKVSEGEGPGNALDSAVRLALKPFYPKIEKFKLTDFKVRILDGTDGTGAKTRVHVETSDGYERWDTVGVSRNIIEATYLAIVDSLDYGLLMQNEIPQNKHLLNL
ncbi:MAG: citramalate synthase [Candidatus Melainabacteria bacterium GWA2_34_9]|nr:MAG: citramalate synthase [Candidatus Melainabacteria bacterium GWA2_34_9]